MTGRVSFVGAGPGAADLITLRGAKRLAEADIVVWAASLVDPECVREHARPEAELIDSSLITHEDVLAVYRRAARERLRVARVHSGDPALWGAVQEQYDSCQRLGLEVEIVPGVSAFSAAAAIAGRELTVPEVAQSVILTRLEGGKTPMPDGEHIREFARHGTTMAIFLSAARSGQLVEELRAGGYADDTPVIVAYKATWPDELILHTTIGELTETVKQHKLWRHTLFLVGRALKSGGTRSHLYHAGHFHTYRKADPSARRALRTEGTGPLPESSPPESSPPESGLPESSRPESRPESSLSESSLPGSSLPGSSSDTSRKSWSLHASRPARVAARLDSPASATSASSATSAAAWSAVRGWQETARSTTGRGGARPRTEPRPLRAVRSAQAQEAFDLQPDHPQSQPGQPQPDQTQPDQPEPAQPQVTDPQVAQPQPSPGEQPQPGQTQPPQTGQAQPSPGGRVEQAGQANAKQERTKRAPDGQEHSAEVSGGGEPAQPKAPRKAPAKATARKPAARRSRKKSSGTSRAKPPHPE